MRRFLNALAAERQKLSKEEAAADRQRAEAERKIERVKRSILDGMAGPTTAAMLHDAEEAELGVLCRLAVQSIAVGDSDDDGSKQARRSGVGGGG